jgi:hypothetical protein
VNKRGDNDEKSIHDAIPAQLNEPLPLLPSLPRSTGFWSPSQITPEQ